MTVTLVTVDDGDEALALKMTVTRVAVEVRVATQKWYVAGLWSRPVDSKPTGCTMSSAHQRVVSIECPA